MINMFPPSEGEITTLNRSITPTDTDIEVSKIDIFPPAPNVAVIGDGYRRELIMYHGIEDNTLTDCTRGLRACMTSPTGYEQDPTLARNWGAGIDIHRPYTSVDHTGIIGNIQEVFKMAEEMNLMQLTGRFTDHALNTQNPHQTTKAHIGLGNVDNTSDMDKPLSTAAIEALREKHSLKPTLLFAHAGFNFNDLTDVGFYEIVPVAPATFTNNATNTLNVPFTGTGVPQTILLHVYKGEDEGVIYQVGHTVATGHIVPVARSSRTNGETWTPWFGSATTSGALSGTWTPTFTGGANVTIAQITGSNWVRSGRLINAVAQVVLQRAVATTNTNLTFAGLPFAALATANLQPSPVTFSTSGITHAWFADTNGVNFRIIRPNHVQATTDNIVFNGAVGTQTIMRINMLYRANV